MHASLGQFVWATFLFAQMEIVNSAFSFIQQMGVRLIQKVEDAHILITTVWRKLQHKTGYLILLVQAAQSSWHASQLRKGSHLYLILTFWHFTHCKNTTSSNYIWYVPQVASPSTSSMAPLTRAGHHTIFISPTVGIYRKTDNKKKLWPHTRSK